jgi:2-C-methyl-D-erythritol 4-phosphate cytidylyltransferase/2-C-methyl-D-erythritol 2,4-cyclodiphosphate synthase
VADTVKKVDGEAVAETIDREQLVTAQTPQAFVASILRDAFSTLQQIDAQSDCAGLVEARGGRVRVVQGDRRLLKITEPEDLELIASWL